MKFQDRKHALDAKRAMESLHSWESPDQSILDDRRGDLPEFPFECFAPRVSEWVKRAAAGAGVTPAHVAVPALGIASSLVGMARRVKASTAWFEPVTSWVGVVEFSGSGKTPGMDAIKRPLAKIERLNREKVAELQRKHETAVEKARAARALWKKQVEEATEAGVPPPVMPAAATEPGKFVAPRLYISDGTIERFGELLQARPQGVLRLTDELSAMFMNMSRYSGGQDNEFWLECWNGSSYTVERIGRQLVIDHLLIGVVGGFQPDKLAKSFEGAADGMYARMLFSWPSEPPYKKLNNDAQELDVDIMNTIGRLNGVAEFEDNALVMRSMDLDVDALRTFEQFRQFVHAQKASVDGREREWLAKGPAHVLRLAGTLCLLEWALTTAPTAPTTVAAPYVVDAVKLVKEYFWPHARGALRQIGLSERHVNARRALRWIAATGKTEVSIKDIRRDAMAGSLDEEGAKRLLDALENAGWVRKVGIAPTGGRPLHRWETNLSRIVPAGTAGTAETKQDVEIANDFETAESPILNHVTAGSPTEGCATQPDGYLPAVTTFDTPETAPKAPSGNQAISGGYNMTGVSAVPAVPADGVLPRAPDTDPWDIPPMLERRRPPGLGPKGDSLDDFEA